MIAQKSSAGFSLLELVIALVFCTILLAQLSYIYLSNQRLINLHSNLSRAQENLRFSTNILQKNIRMTGYSGCAKINNLQFSNHTDEKFNLESSLQGYDSSNLPRYLQHKVLNGTDVIEIKKADLDVTTLQVDVASGSKIVKVKQNPATENNQILLIADCTHADLFLAHNWQGNAVRTNQALSHAYRAESTEVSRFEVLAFFISDTGRTDAKGKPIFSLYLDANRGNKQELVEGVEAMKINYYVDGHYYRANKISELNWWEKVQGVEIKLRLQNVAVKEPRLEIFIKLQER
jgi:type IV pilus assembly protein PilW